jgi:hypothetical protein
MLLALALSLTVPLTSDPPIRIKLSDDAFIRGEQARVRVKTAEDGYLLVLRADGQGHIRVLFPLEPTENGTIRGRKEFEVRGRGDRAAFVVDEGEGSGKVLAARSREPFRFDQFSHNSHWDYAALVTQDSTVDAEAALLDLVEKMAAGPYDYDVVTYTVSAHPAYRRLAGWGWGGWGWNDPWFGCWRCRGFYGPYFGPRIGFGTTIFIGGRRHW